MYGLEFIILLIRTFIRSCLVVAHKSDGCIQSQLAFVRWILASENPRTRAESFAIVVCAVFFFFWVFFVHLKRTSTYSMCEHRKPYDGNSENWDPFQTVHGRPCKWHWLILFAAEPNKRETQKTRRHTHQCTSKRSEIRRNGARSERRESLYP